MMNALYTALMLGGAAGAAFAAPPLPPVLDPAAIDRSVDPCQDFFQYSCGTWLRENPVPADQSKWYRFSLLDEHTLSVLRNLLAQAAAERNRTSPNARKIGDYYAACMDEPAIDAKGLKPLKPELDAIDALKDKAGLAAAIAHLHSIGAWPAFSFGSTQDYTDATREIANADQGGFALPDRDYYLLDDFQAERTDYRAHLERMFGLLGDTTAQAAAEAAAVLDLETALAKAAMGRVERREPKNVHHKLQTSEFTRLAPSFGWGRYLNDTQPPPFKALDVSDPDFFKGLDAALTKFGLPEWKSYLRWRLVFDLVDALPTPFVNESFAFFGRRLGGQQELKARWKRCVESADRRIGEALGQAYVESEFPPEAKARVVSLVAEIESSMENDIAELEWMSPPTKELALTKLHSLANKIGYPDRWRDYSKLEVSPADALGNLQRAAGFEFRRRLAKIGKPVDRGEWFMTPPTDNAYYNPQMNDINFPAGILQPPNFDVRADTAAVLGAIGATIAHELTHAFDDEGRRYDARGNLADWWTEADGKAFEERAKGFVDEYSRFVTVESTDPARAVRLNGQLTLGENIADNGGLVLAYRVLERLTDAKTPPLDGFDARQRLFVSYAQSWCLNQTEESRRKAAKVDPHSPGRYRVNGVVVNMPEFAKAFSCAPGSPMAPGPVHRVW